MKNILSGGLICLALVGCSKTPTDLPPKDGLPHNISTNGLPFAVTVAETTASQEWANLMLLSRTYFESKEYDKLEDLATSYRSVEESRPDGNWKIVPVYIGLELSDSEKDDVWIARQKALQEWVQVRPSSITAQVALARNLTDFAWKARGGGFADSVSDSAGKLFAERLGEAAKVLHEAASCKAKCPVYWTTLMKVARGLQTPKTQFDAIFKQAAQAWPDYSPIYIQESLQKS